MDRRDLYFALALWLALFVQPAVAASTRLVSVSSVETQGNFASGDASISADGRFIAFSSRASNLVPGDTNDKSDVFVRDRVAGTTRRVSVSSAGRQGNGDSFEPAISGNGRFVAFTSAASNLIASDDRPQRDVFVHDRLTGATEKVNTRPYTVCDPDDFECASDEDESSATISFDGARIAFILSTSDQIFDAENLFLRDMGSGVTTEIAHGVENHTPSISADGRVLAWECQPLDHVENTNLCIESLPAAGSAAGLAAMPLQMARRLGEPKYHRDPSISADGRFVAYWYDDQVENSAAVYLLDGSKGRNDPGRVQKISLSGDTYGKAYRPSISANGRLVSYAMDVGSGKRGVFVWDRVSKVTKRVDTRPNNTAASAVSDSPSVSGDGRFIAFSSNASDLVAGDTNGRQDVFVRDRGGRNDVLVDFGARGLWQWMNNRNWVEVRASSPNAIAAGDLDGDFKDEALGAFPGGGLLARYGNIPPWKKLFDKVPVRIAACDLDGNGGDDVAAGLGPSGLWILLSRGNWVRSRPESARGIACGDLDGNGRAELIASFGAVGLWAFFNNTTWVKLRPSAPERIVAGDLDGNGLDDLVADFGNTGVLVRYNNTPPWQKIRNATTRGLAVGDIDGNGKQDLLLALPSQGLWVLLNNAKPLVRLHFATPRSIITADLDGSGKDDVLISLPTGLWARYDNAGAWRQLRSWPVEAFAAGGFD